MSAGLKNNPVTSSQRSLYHRPEHGGFYTMWKCHKQYMRVKPGVTTDVPHVVLAVRGELHQQLWPWRFSGSTTDQNCSADWQLEARAEPHCASTVSLMGEGK